MLASCFGHFASAAEPQPAAHGVDPPDQRIFIEARIDGRPARLLFDTGASFTALFATPADRLGLESEMNRSIRIAGHDVPTGLTRLVDVTLLGKNGNARLPILPFPPPVHADGVLGWKTLGDDPFLIDAGANQIQIVKEPPKSGWQRWPMDTDSSQLFFTVTDNGNPLGRVFVDTGSPIGLRISPNLWEAWKNKNPKAGLTLTTYRYAVGEPMIHELAWAADYSLGDLPLRDIDIGPVPESDRGRALDANGKEFIATIGMRGLRHLRMIVNRSSKEVMTRPVSPVPVHNRIGAVFRTTTKEAVSGHAALVLENSPAHKAGLRTGDMLLSVNGTPFSRDSGSPPPDLERLFSQPAGIRVVLEIKRGNATHEFGIVLEDMLP